MPIALTGASDRPYGCPAFPDGIFTLEADVAKYFGDNLAELVARRQAGELRHRSRRRDGAAK